MKKTAKGLSGLTDSIIDELQNYYGMAIRSNVNNLQGMKSAVAAVLFHVASTDANPWHDHCPDGADSWCRYKRDIVLGTNECVHGKGLTMEIIKHVKPIFHDLQTDSL